MISKILSHATAWIQPYVRAVYITHAHILNTMDLRPVAKSVEDKELWPQPRGVCSMNTSTEFKKISSPKEVVYNHIVHYSKPQVTMT